MKIPTTEVCLLTLASFSNAFAPSPVHIRTSTELSWFFDKPFHAHGSLEDDLDEQWEAQQAILRARRSEGLDKQHLKQKYRGSKDTASPNLHAKQTPHFMWEETWTDEVEPQMKNEASVSKPQKKAKFFWDK